MAVNFGFFGSELDIWTVDNWKNEWHKTTDYYLYQISNQKSG